MALNWLDVSSLSFNALLLLERVQLSWLPAVVPASALAVALQANPAVEWFMRHKCPDLHNWLDEVLAQEGPNQPATPGEIRQAEETILKAVNDWLVYVVEPALYDAQPFLQWDSRELTSLVDFRGKTVIDVGAGTGRLALTAAETAQTVFAVEPVANLRHYLKQKARRAGFQNLFVVDGLITDIPFPDAFAGVTMGGHVFGDQPEAEYQELARVTKPGGCVILCPGNSDSDNKIHHFLAVQGFQWASFLEPEDGMKRKYWKTINRGT